MMKESGEMQACKRLGSLILVLVFSVSFLTAVPVLGEDDESSTLEQTESGWTMGDTGKNMAEQTLTTSLAAPADDDVIGSVSEKKTESWVEADSSSVTGQASAGVEYFVSPEGSDSNAGSFEAPFATITKARDVIREAIKQGLGEGSIVVNIMGGEYPVSSTIAFTAADSGTENCPITYRAYNDEKVTFTASTVISADKISKLTESDQDIYGNKILDRLQDPVAKSKVIKIDLSEYAGEIPVLSEGWSYSWTTPWPKNTTPVDVYVNGSVIKPARWPNNEEGTAMFTPVAVASEKTSSGGHDNTKPVSITYPDPDNATANWNQQAIKDDLMIAGYFGVPWYMNEHKVGEMDTKNKVVKTLGGTALAPVTHLPYYLYNIIEAIDAPGEGYIDRKNKIAYFYPDSEIDENADIRVAGNNSLLLSVTGTKYINFEGLDFEYNRANAVSLSKVDHVTWDSCDVAHTGSGAMSASGTNITIQNCHIYDIGMTGLTISGGNRKTLTPSNNLVTNNVFHDQGRVRKTYVPAIRTSNLVGATISHNEIYNNHHQAIELTSSNDIIIEYNDLHNVVSTAGDMGAIYCGRNVTEMGYVIRYNKFSHIGSKYSQGSQSIFFDDANSGGDIYGNIFYRATMTMDEGATISRSYAVRTNSGQFNHVYHNIFVDVPSAARFDGWTSDGYSANYDGQTEYVAYNFDMTLSKSGTTITFDKISGSQWNKFTSVGFNDGIWAEHYKGTIWEPVFRIFTQENHDSLVSYLPVKNSQGEVISAGNPKAASYLIVSIAPKNQNFFRDNVAVKVKNSSVVVANGNVTRGKKYTNDKITTADGKPLFVDYENENFRLTEEGLAEVRKTVADFPNVDTSKIGPQTPVDGSRPVASNVKLTGDSVPGGKVNVTYNYSDADNQKEVATTYQWYAAEAADGDYELIRGEFTTEFTIPDSLQGKYIKCVVTPSDSRLLPGKAVETVPVQILTETPDVDKSKLEKAIAAAKTLRSGAVQGDRYGQYTHETIANFDAIIAEAEQVNKDSNAVQETVDELVSVLENAAAAFKKSANKEMEVVENGEITINYDLDSAKFTVHSGIGNATLKMEPNKAQPMYQFICKSAAGDVTVDVAKNAVFSASGWDGTFKLPVAGDRPSGPISGKDYMVVTMGDANQVITSSNLARIVLPGQGGKPLAYKAEDGKYKTIDENTNLPADTMEAAKAELPSGGVAKLTVGDDLVIYTSLLTEFVAYNFKTATFDPSVSDVALDQTGSVQVNKIIQGSYTYSDQSEEEGDTTYQWLVSDTQNGTYTPISGETETSYTPGGNMIGKYIKFRVLPKDILGTSGEAKDSVPVQIVRPGAKESFSATNILYYQGDHLITGVISGETKAKASVTNKLTGSKLKVSMLTAEFTVDEKDKKILVQKKISTREIGGGETVELSNTLTTTGGDHRLVQTVIIANDNLEPLAAAAQLRGGAANQIIYIGTENEEYAVVSVFQINRFGN